MMSGFNRRNGNRDNLLGKKDDSLLPSTVADVGQEERTILEDENEDAIGMLGERVNRMRQVAVEIGSEVRGQNDFLDGMDTQMQRARGLISGATRKVGNIRSSSQGGFLCFFVVVLLILFFLIYFVIRFTTRK